jgi:23S rRNA (cytosine1962-C5)-methyltransferase
VAQINSAPIEIFWLQIRARLQKAFQQTTQREPQIFELRNTSVRLKEGLLIIEPENSPAPVTLSWNGFKWQMTPAGSQKTGAYFDQRENHKRAAALASELKYKSAWDLCAYQGGFSLHLLKEGLEVTAIDQSAAALAQASANVKLNSLPLEKFHTAEADIFVWLKQKVANREKTDLIVLDPPSFVKSRQEIQPALRGYEDLNTLALKCLNPGGMLVSCVCSHHVTPKLYEGVLKRAGEKSGVKFKVLESHGPSADHAAGPAFTEGHYLQAWFISSREG